MMPLEETINKALQEKVERLKQSEEYLRQYLKTRNPQIVRDYLQSSLYALEESRWVVEVIAKWQRDGEHDLLQSLFRLPRGAKKGANDTFKLYGLTVVMVDTLTAQGMSHEAAFKKLASLRGFGGVETVRKSYYKTRKSKRMYQLYVEDTEDSYILAVRNARVAFTLNGVDQNLFGCYKVWIPKDTTNGDAVTLNIEGVTVDDENFQRLCSSLREIP
jgi:hypothetical protein